MKAVRDLMQRGVTDGVFPGGVLLVAKEGLLQFFEAFGLARLSPERPMTTDTVFDLASLTKPLATSVALMRLVQQGRLNLDQTLGKTIPDFSGTDKAEITIHQLLCHASGLPDYRPYYETLIKHPAADRKAVLYKLLSGEALIHEPGEVCLYSDLGFMILQWLIETATEMSLHRFVEESVYGPLGLKHLFFVPLQASPGATPANQAVVLENQFAATEDCPWRGKILDGEVHDDNAYALGGVAGHAGLFGTARDVYGLLKELLNVYDGKTNSGLFRRDVVETFFKRQSDTGTWALGFDTPTRPDSSSGRFFSDQSVGHLGFAGTSFWVDLLEGVMVILLTNRVHPDRKNERIKPFRPILHDTVMDSILTRPS